MTKFHYSAVSRSGTKVSGVRQASSQSDIVDWLIAQGHTPLSVSTSAFGGGLGGLSTLGLSGLFGSGGLSQSELATLTRDMSTLIEQGLGVERSLRILRNVSEKQRVQTTIDDITTNLKGGASFSAAITKSDAGFPTYYTNLVAAAEASGTLPQVLARLSKHLERTEEVRGKIVSALIYPAFLMILVFLTLIVIVTFVLPQFEAVFSEAGVKLPFATRAVIGLGTAITDYGWAIALGFAGLVALLIQALQKSSVRTRLDRMMLRSPLLFGLPLKSETANVSRTLGLLLQNGLPLSTALARARETTDNIIIEEACEKARNDVREGRRLAASLTDTKVFSPLVLQLVTVGEETGRLDDMLLQLADIYDREVESGVDRALSLLVPILTALMGLIVGGLIASVLVGILSVNQLAF